MQPAIEVSSRLDSLYWFTCYTPYLRSLNVMYHLRGSIIGHGVNDGIEYGRLALCEFGGVLGEGQFGKRDHSLCADGGFFVSEAVKQGRSELGVKVLAMDS